jgi:hypothetical protein
MYPSNKMVKYFQKQTSLKMSPFKEKLLQNKNSNGRGMWNKPGVPKKRLIFGKHKFVKYSKLKNSVLQR